MIQDISFKVMIANFTCLALLFIPCSIAKCKLNIVMGRVFLCPSVHSVLGYS